jgi:hypothetical protein
MGDPKCGTIVAGVALGAIIGAGDGAGRMTRRCLPH